MTFFLHNVRKFSPYRTMKANQRMLPSKTIAINFENHEKAWIV